MIQYKESGIYPICSGYHGYCTNCGQTITWENWFYERIHNRKRKIRKSIQQKDSYMWAAAQLSSKGFPWFYHCS